VANRCPLPQIFLDGHKVHHEVHADQIFVIDCVALDFHNKFGYKIGKSEGPGALSNVSVPGVSPLAEQLFA